MRKSTLKLVFLLLVGLGLAGPGLAATITVEKDGSGDFTHVQPALDAAASGDTVLIGPGEFTKLILSYIPGYAYDVEVCAYVHVPNLTIIGAGVGQTILGPASYPGDSIQFSPKCMVWLDGNDRFVEGITFRNCYEGMHIVEGPLYVDSCEFLNNGGYGIIWVTHEDGGYVRNSFFSSSLIQTYGLGMGWSGSNIIVENCVFDNASISIQHIQGISFINCEMMNAYVGIQLSAGARGVLDNCRIHDCFTFGVSLTPVGSHLNIVNSQISGDVAAVASRSSATLYATGTEFFGGEDSVLFLFGSDQIVIHDSHLIPSGPLAVNCSRPEGLGLVVHDLTGNFWGTTDPDTVANWIWDQNDDPSIFAVVDYLPMADGPVPTEEKSFGSIKAMFR